MFNKLSFSREIEYVCTWVHFKDLERLEWLVTLCMVCTRDAMPDYYSIPPLAFGCVARFTKYSFEIEPQLMNTTM
jgi:hypothetical protein